MVKKVYSVFDVKAKIFDKPFHMSQNGEAMRLFGDAVNDEKTMFFRHPEDYQLFLIAEFDDNSGMYKSLEHPDFLCNGIDFKKE